jgi:hypothetical protein
MFTYETLTSLLKNEERLRNPESRSYKDNSNVFLFLLQGLHLPDENGREKRHKGAEGHRIFLQLYKIHIFE